MFRPNPRPSSITHRPAVSAIALPSVMGLRCTFTEALALGTVPLVVLVVLLVLISSGAL